MGPNEVTLKNVAVTTMFEHLLTIPTVSAAQFAHYQFTYNYLSLTFQEIFCMPDGPSASASSKAGGCYGSGCGRMRRTPVRPYPTKLEVRKQTIYRLKHALAGW